MKNNHILSIVFAVFIFAIIGKTSIAQDMFKDNFSNIEVEYKERSKLVPVRGTLSNAKSKDLLGYRSEWPLEKGYQQYISWYKDFFDKKINVN